MIEPADSMRQSRERWAAVNVILDEVFTAPAGDQAILVDRLCGDDADLRREVMALLESDRVESGILEERAEVFAAPFVPDTETPEDPAGRRLGAYRLVERIGRGGMGTVFVAERADGQFAQRVAIKLVKRGMDTDEIVARFLRERQILARLQHPNIAQILDGGIADDGRPYFVMELVEGRPITTYCVEEDLTVPARLALFEQVCRTVDFAHRNLVVHRDLKPSNVLVNRDASVKLLDFGIAKVLSNADAQWTATCDRVLFFTPEYASPEQLRGEAVVTPSDVYQLGILLYEILSGRRPASPHAGASRPSSVVSRVVMRKSLSGDLDAVTMKALRPEPDRRYHSAGALADDVRRHLDGRPVLARDEGVWYRVAKFVRRHRAAVAAAGLIAAIVAVGTVYYAQRIRAERDRANLEAAKAIRSAALLERMIATWNPAATERSALTSRDVLQIAELSAGFGDPGAPAARSGEDEIHASSLSLLGSLNTSLGDIDRGRALLGQARAIQETLGAERDLAGTLTRQGQLYELTGAFAEGEQALKRAIAIYERDDPRSPEVLQARVALASLLQRGQRFQEAEGIVRSVLDDTRRVDLFESRWLAAYARIELGDLLTQMARTADAITELEAARVENEQLFGRRHGFTYRATFSLAHALRDHGRLEASEARYREALDLARTIYGEDHAQVAGARWMFAMILERRAAFDSAEEQASLARQWWERRGVAGPMLVTLLASSGGLAFVRGRYDVAEPPLQLALAKLRELFTDNQDEGDLLNRLAFIHLGRGGPRAHRLYAEAVNFHKRRPPGSPLFPTDAIEALAWCMREMGDLREAELTFRQALDVYHGRVADGHPHLVRAVVGLGLTLVDLKRPAEAEPVLLEGVRQAMARLELNGELLDAAKRGLARLHLKPVRPR